MTEPRFFAGVDCGSWNAKAVVLDDEARIAGAAVVRTGAELLPAAERALAGALKQAEIGRDSLRAVWSTGFGRHAIAFADGSRTELDAHARGAVFGRSGPLTVVDIGGQDAKVIRMDAQGRRVSHRMNRKCAAGTGSFLEEISLRLDVRIEDLPALATGFTEELDLGSFCTVFTGTEILSAIRQGKRPADLARAAYKSVVKRVAEMESYGGTVVATGGVVAHHPMVVDLMRSMLGVEVQVPDRPQFAGAFGVALWARSSLDGAASAREGT